LRAQPRNQAMSKTNQSRRHMMRRQLTRVVVSLLLLSVVLIVRSSAQVNTGSLTGLVADPNGAVGAGATVMAKNQATGVNYTATTDASGYYTFASLPVGTYTLSVEL